MSDQNSKMYDLFIFSASSICEKNMNKKRKKGKRIAGKIIKLIKSEKWMDKISPRILTRLVNYIQLLRKLVELDLHDFFQGTAAYGAIIQPRYNRLPTYRWPHCMVCWVRGEAQDNDTIYINILNKRKFNFLYHIDIANMYDIM